jgi:predicted phage baseplate assembly protein
MSYPVCPCDGEQLAAPTNLPELTQISYRVGTYVDFRQAVLTPLLLPATPAPLPIEQTLSVAGAPVWRTDGDGDLAVMIAEWFAYIADIIAFYNERIANEDYLRTAVLPASVNDLIALIGYRPRPAIGATGFLAALLSPGPSFGNPGVRLPKGLQFQSKPTPGQPPQFFELLADTTIFAPDQLTAAPAPILLGTVTTPAWRFDPYRRMVFEGGKFGIGGGINFNFGSESIFLLQGAVKTVDPGAVLILRARDATLGGPWLVNVSAVTVGPSPSGAGQQTSLTITFPNGVPPSTLSAAQASLESASQSTALWTLFPGAISNGGATVDLAGLVRQVRPGDWLLFTSKSQSPTAALAQVASTADVVWDANATSVETPPLSDGTTTTTTSSGSTATTTSPIPIPHTELTLTSATALPNAWSNPAAISVQFGWVSVGTLIDQPFGAWSGAPLALQGSGATPFPAWSEQPMLLQDLTGLGIAAVAGSPGSFDLTLAQPAQDPVPSLQPPFLVLPNVLAVSRGKTVQNEVLGSGDATQPAQDFKLSQSPVTYLQSGATYASTIALTVNGMPWTEVANFYGQPADATVFVAREDNSGATHVMFGDGVNGARLPTGVNNVIATYRVGAGAASPPAGKLSVIAKPYPGLRAVLNPVAVGGGSDPDPPQQIRRYAPRSVLTFGRAVSVFDFQALAAQTPGVTRARALWGWDDARQRALVWVYVGDDAAAATAAQSALTAAGDPNRPVRVTQASAVQVALELALVITPGIDTAKLTEALTIALTDTEAGLFGSWNMAIGQTVFVSQIETAALGVQGVVALTALTLFANDSVQKGPLFNPGEAGYFTLDPADITLTLEPDPNG